MSLRGTLGGALGQVSKRRGLLLLVGAACCGSAARRLRRSQVC